jgi:hypothetical protein
VREFVDECELGTDDGFTGGDDVELVNEVTVTASRKEEQQFKRYITPLDGCAISGGEGGPGLVDIHRSAPVS